MKFRRGLNSSLRWISQRDHRLIAIGLLFGTSVQSFFVGWVCCGVAVLALALLFYSFEAA